MTTIERKRGRERVCVCVYVFDFVRLFFTLQTLFSLRRPPPPLFPVFLLSTGGWYVSHLHRIWGGLGGESVCCRIRAVVSLDIKQKGSLSLSRFLVSLDLSLCCGAEGFCVWKEQAGQAGAAERWCVSGVCEDA